MALTRWALREWFSGRTDPTKPTNDLKPILDRAFRQQSQRSLERVTAVRTLMFIGLLLWLFLNYGFNIAAQNAGIMVLFIANGLAAFWLGKSRQDWAWVPFAVLAIDAVLLGFTLLTPGRTYPEFWPWATVLRQPSFLYFYLLLALATLSLQPLLVLWAGFLSVAVWCMGAWLIIRSEGSLVTIPDDSGEWLTNYLDPNYIHLDDLLVRGFITIIVSIILALTVRRARELVREQAEAARERANLARYVAPNLVEQLAASDQPMGIVRSLDVAVLFVDIKGFTMRAERLGPEQSMAYLRHFHSVMAEIVFEHGGTLDKFIGDGLMATFGTPENAPDDASQALHCAFAMLEAGNTDDRTAATRAIDPQPLELGVGLHYGRVTIGDIGGGGRFEFAVIGDAVNVAARVEELTRTEGTALLVTDSLVEKARSEGMDISTLEKLATLTPIRGRVDKALLWRIK